MSEDLTQLEEMAGRLIANMTGPRRRSLLRAIARDLRQSQRDRIARQENPDGTPFAPRREKEPPQPGNYTARFLYPSSGRGAPRVVLMKSWVREGPLLTGFDVEAGGIRSFEADKIIRWLPVEQADENKGAGRLRRRRGSVRRKAMFRRLRTYSFLKTGATDHEVWVGFTGAAARVARIHQFGLRDKPAPRARDVKYDQRELLGLTAADRENLIALVLDHLEG